MPIVTPSAGTATGHPRAEDFRAATPELSGAIPLSPAAGSPPAPAAPPSDAPRAAAAAAAPAAARRRPGAPPPDADAAWARAFGAPHVGSQPEAIAVDGDVVYLGGSFIDPMAGMPEGTYNRIARWDGTAWERMGDGLDGTVHAILVHGDHVYVGGEFTVAGGKVAASRLARWDGKAWSAVAGGVALRDQPSLAAVRALACDGTRLYVAGSFDTVGAGAKRIRANGFAALTLATGTWETYAGGLWFQSSPGEGRALAIAGDRVYVGGSFDRAGRQVTGSIAALDPATKRWTKFGTGVTSGDFIGSVDSLAVDDADGTLYVGGSFTAAGTVETSGVATLKRGRWGTLGPFELWGNAGTATVRALAVSAGRLYAGGEFTLAGNAAATNWAVYEKGEWSPVGDGVDNAISALAPYRGGVVVTGAFAWSGERRIVSAGIWTGADWDAFGQGVTYDPYGDGHVYAVVAADSRAYVGGYFDQAGALRVGSVAEWAGDAWRDMAGGVRDGDGVATVYGMLRHGGDLYVTGRFTSAGDGAAANVARWDGTSWSAMGSGLNDPGYALAVAGGKVYVAGNFSAAGGTGASGVAAWDPATGTWSALGNAPRFDDTVMSLAVIYDRYLVIGGKFTALRRDNRDLWRGLNGLVVFDTQAPIDDDPLAGFLGIAGVQQSSGAGMVRGLQVLGPDLYVGGTFDTAGVLEWTAPTNPGFAAQNLAVWHFGREGGGWSSPGGTDEPVMAFATLDGRSLVIGGHFAAAGPIAAAGVVEHDPQAGTWTAYGSGIGPGERGVRRIEALAQAPEDGLWVGGTFNTAGGRPGCSVGLWRGTAGRTP